MADMVKQPAHYTKGKIEVWDFILDQGMNYLEGNIIKYLCRYKHKGNPVQDLDKAIAYLTKLRDTEYAKQEPKLLPNGTFDKAGTITIKPAPTPGVDEHVAQAVKQNKDLQTANAEIIEKQRRELIARGVSDIKAYPTYGHEVFRPTWSYYSSEYDRS